MDAVGLGLSRSHLERAKAVREKAAPLHPGYAFDSGRAERGLVRHTIPRSAPCPAMSSRQTGYIVDVSAVRIVIIVKPECIERKLAENSIETGRYAEFRQEFQITSDHFEAFVGAELDDGRIVIDADYGRASGTQQFG